MNENIFETCSKINDLLTDSKEKEAREELIKLLDYHETKQIEYTPIVNHLIRETGLYPYIHTDTANWEDKFVCEAFKIDTGEKEEKTLHREQSLLLKKLIEGKNIAVSAPTSFGKSFVIDAFISLKNPNNVVIIVPTIALTDETRRRIYKKFATKYKIITTPEVVLGERNIFIFPQERAISYIEKINSIDILIIDEFYKAGIAFDKDRAPILLKAILELGKKAKQKYFLAPNISDIENLGDSPFTSNMEFIPLDFNTVFSDIHKNYKEHESSNVDFKQNKLLEILSEKSTKSLIYAGTFTNIDAIANVLNKHLVDKHNAILDNFSDWLRISYCHNYILTDLVKKGVGIHNGKLHRSLSQIQVKLFEESDGLDNIISTSSIIEGVNTCAENVIIWANKNGRPRLNDFTYRNIVGRGGRMFKHFIGKVFLFEEPPQQEFTQLKLEFTDDLVTSLDKEKFKGELTREQEIKIIAFNDDMDDVLGKGVYEQIKNSFQTFSPSNLKSIASDMRNNPTEWNGLVYLNSENVNEWDRNLYLILNRIGGGAGAYYRDMVAYIKAISQNWNRTIPQMLPFLQSNGVTIEKFFEMERTVTFKVATMLKDVNLLYNYIFQKKVDISPFISRISYAFLPKLVYELEEYGLPRMVSKKIQNAGIIDLENFNTPIHEAISQFNQIGLENIKQRIPNLHSFESYILDYFYDGIKTE
ncbi:hypothetical protein AGMMS50262_13580 [Bacteroidia bacterium]|nr:hypothetical protein AGMMS50262_13580 [Bacteroidia bacterium]